MFERPISRFLLILHPGVLGLVGAFYLGGLGYRRIAAIGVASCLTSLVATFFMTRRQVPTAYHGALLASFWILAIAIFPWKLVNWPQKRALPVEWSQQTSHPDKAIEFEFPLSASDWASWRGSRSDGIAAATSVPSVFPAVGSAHWKCQVPGIGYSSPCMVQGRIFITTADDSSSSQGLICIDGKAGNILWSRQVHSSPLVSIHAKNSHASSTPASDGKFIFCAFLCQQGGEPAIWLTAVDFAGQIRWQTRCGAFRNIEGYGASPCIADGKVIVAGDNLDESFIAAYEAATGELCWRTERTPGASYCSPVVALLDGKYQVVLHGNQFVHSYDVVEGKELWRCGSLPQHCANTPAFDAANVYVSGGSPEKAIMAVRTDGVGDVTQSHVLWRTTSNVPYVSTPVVHQGRLFMITEQGVSTYVDVQTGKPVWKKRLQGNFSASPVLAGDRIFIVSEEGRVYVIEAHDEFKELAMNDLGEPCFATPAITPDRIYIRTDSSLHCIQGHP